jgi:hypothetical protein
MNVFEFYYVILYLDLNYVLDLFFFSKRGVSDDLNVFELELIARGEDYIIWNLDRVYGVTFLARGSESSNRRIIN